MKHLLSWFLLYFLTVLPTAAQSVVLNSWYLAFMEINSPFLEEKVFPVELFENPSAYAGIFGGIILFYKIQRLRPKA